MKGFYPQKQGDTTWKLLLPCCTEGNLTLGDRVFSFDPHTLFLLGEEIYPHLTSTQPLNYILLPFDFKWFSSFSSEQSDFLWLTRDLFYVIPLNQSKREEILSLYEKIEEDDGNFGSDILRKMSIFRLLLAIFPLIESNKLDNTQNTYGIDHRITPIVDYIKNNIAEPLNLDLISKEFFLSKTYLCRVFKSSMGVSVIEYIISCRVKKACTLLQEGYSVQRSGELSGFSDNSHFIRTFGKLTGVSPGKYAKEFNISQKKSY